MAISTEQVEKLITLLKSEELSFVRQGLDLVESVCDIEAAFRSLLSQIHGRGMPGHSDFGAYSDVFGSFPHSCYLALWSLWRLAQWHPNTMATIIEFDLSSEQLRILPDKIRHLINLRALKLSGNSLTVLGISQI